MIDINKEFGNLRSIMQDRAPLNKESFMTWLVHIEAFDPERYHTQWVPYLAGFMDRWTTPLATVDTVERLEDAARIAPFATFVFDGSAWTALRRYALDQGKVAPRGWPPGFLTYHGFNDDKMAELVESEALGRVVHLNLVWGSLTEHGVHMLAQCPATTQLRTLEMRYHYAIKNEGIFALLASPYITHIESLDVSQTHADGHGFRALAQSTFSTHLRELHYDNDVEPLLIADDFHASNTLTQLTHLSLSNTACQDICDILTSPNASALRTFTFDATEPITLEHVQHIAKSPYTSHLRRLDFSGLGLTDAHLEILASSRHLEALQTLDLSGNQVTSEGIAHLATAPWLGQIKSLDLSNNPLDARAFRRLCDTAFMPTHLVLKHFQEGTWDLDEGLAAWLATPNSARLTHLDLYNVHLSQSLDVLAQAHHIEALTKLCIGHTRVNAETLAHLVQSPVAQHLEHLELSYIFDEDPGPVRHLCEGIESSPYLHQLTHLILDNLDMADEALISLSQAPQCRALTKLSLEGSDFSEKGLRAFAASPYFTHLEELELGLDYAYPDEPMSAQRKILFDSPHLAEAIRIRFDPSMHLDEV